MKNRYKIIFVLLFVSLVSCTDDTPTVDDNFLNYEIPDVPVTDDIDVGAFYYNMGAGGLNQTYYNRLIAVEDYSSGKVGPYVKPVYERYTTATNQTTVSVMQQHVDWALRAGINFFILPSIGESATDTFPKNVNAEDIRFVNLFTGKIGSDGLSADTTTGTKVDLKTLKYALSINISTNISAQLSNTLPIENADSTTIKTKKFSRTDRLLNLVKRVSDYFADASYYTIDGKPVLLIINPQLLYSSDSKALYDNIRSTIKNYSGKDVYIVAQQQNWTPPARFEYFFLKGGVDAVTHVNMLEQTTYDRSYWYPQLIDQNWLYTKNYLTANWNIDYIPTASVWSNYYVYSGNYNYPIVKLDPDKFSVFCNVAKRNMGKHKIVFFDSFNKWSAASAIEPTDSTYGNGYGVKYLDILRKQFKK